MLFSKGLALALFSIPSVLATALPGPAPVVPHLEERALDLPGIWKNLTTLVTQVNIFITLETLSNNLVKVNFDVHNPTFVELTIDRVTSESGINGTVYSTFDHEFPFFIIPAFSTKNSGTFGNVTLTKGAIASLPIISAGYLDITSAIKVRAATINGALGIPITLPSLKSEGVPANYTLDLSK